MKSLVKVLFRQRIKLEEYLFAGIKVLQELVEMLLTTKQDGQDHDHADRMLDLEVTFEDSFSLFLESLDKKYYLPFYWEDIYEVYTNLGKIFATLHVYYTEQRIFKTRFSFNHFLEMEGRVLENMKYYLKEYMSNRKYSQELLKNNQHELKNFSRLYYHGIASISEEGERSHVTLRLLELFLKINTVNATIQSLLQKILIETNL